MRNSPRTKLMSIAGLLAMLTGLVFILAPSVGADPGGVKPDKDDRSGNVSCADLGYPIEAKDDTSGKPGAQGQASSTSGELVVDWRWDGDGIGFEIVGDSLPVSAVIVKQATVPTIETYDPPKATATGLESSKADDFSHITFCAVAVTQPPQNPGPQNPPPQDPGPQNPPPQNPPPQNPGPQNPGLQNPVSQPQDPAPSCTENCDVVEPGCFGSACGKAESECLGSTCGAVNVAGDEVVAAPAPVPGPVPVPDAAPDVEVMGDEVVATLPVTGAGTQTLVGFGLLLLGMGTTLVGVSRRHATIG